MKISTGIGQLVLRLALGIGFILPVMDRLGLLGPPGTKGVAWGDWQHFVDYTNTLMPFLSKSIANIFAVIATTAEAIFGVCLIIGFKIKWMALGSAAITFLFALFMMISLGIRAPFDYPVFVFTGGALVLSGLGKYKWSTDELFQK